MALGDNADVLLRIRAKDEDGLRLLAAYRKEVARLRRDIEDLNRSGQMRNERGQFMSKEASARLQAANEFRKVQNQAFAEQARNVQQEQQAFTRSFQARSQAQRRYNTAEAAAHVENQRRTTAANNANAQYQQSQLRFQQRINTAHQQALQMNARLNRGGGGTGSPQLTQMEQEDALWKRLRNSVLAYWAARQAGQAIVGFVREGLQFNQILETAQLGIASLITATSKVRDVNGNLLTGAKALEGAYGLAAEQMNKIRIAGLQTAATTEQLVDAFQQALGPGLKAGLNLDQIRQITVQIVQAAGAIGLPFNQLNQEVRSILDATIDRNSRVARVLSITNEEVRLAREQGRLAEFLNEKMAAFTVAGGRAAKTMFVLKSNIKEAFQVFAGQATQDLFVKMRDSLSAVFADAFDFKNLRIAEKFQGLVQAIQEVFSGVGDLFVSALNSMIHGAEVLSGWFERNKVQVGLTVAAFVQLAKELGGALADATKLLGIVLGLGTETNLIALSIKIIADGIGVIRDHVSFLLAAFVGTKLAVFAIGTSLTGDVLPAMVKLRALALANPWVAVAATLATILGLIIAAREAQSVHYEMVTRTAVALAKQHGDAVSDLAKLTKEYQTNADALDKTKKGTEAYANAQEALKRTYDEILKLAPDLKAQSEFEQRSLKDRLELLQKLARQRLADLDVEDAIAFNAAAAAKRELEAEKARPIQFGAISGLPIDNSARIRELTDAADRAQRISDAATRANLVATSSLMRTNAALATLETAPSKIPSKGSKNDPQQIRAAALERAKAEFDVRKAVLQQELEDEDITRTQFHERFIAEINKRADAEIAAHKKLLSQTTDVGERAKINADIEAAEKQRVQDIATFERDTTRETRRLAKAAILQQARDVRDSIQQSNVDVRNAATAINQRIISGEISRQQGAREFKAVVQDQIAQTLEFISTLETLKKTMSDPTAIKRVDEMILQLEGHISDLNAATSRSDQVLQLFGQKFRESTENNLATALDTLIEKSHSLAGVWRSLDDVFRQMAQSIISDITHIISRLIAMQIVESIVGLGMGDFFGGFNAANGGLILGPGSSTSDSIPARLSNGEYVVRASAVKQIGVENLDMINYGAAGARMRPRGSGYAAGGVVESIARTGIASLRVGLDTGLILQTMRSPEGARIHVEHAQRHRNKLRQVSGR